MWWFTNHAFLILFLNSAAKQLPKTLQPINYNLQFKLTTEDLEENNVFSGEVEIEFLVTTETNTITLHGKELTILDKDVNVKQEDINKNLTISKLQWDDDFYIITLEQHLVKNMEYTLSIIYNGKLSTNGQMGFCKRTYYEGTKKKNLAITSFQNGGSRQAFPCFDDPEFKATFDISVSYPVNYTVKSNSGPDGTDVSTNTIYFQTTPELSTHSLALLISQLDCELNLYDKDFEICARYRSLQKTTLAQDLILSILETMKEFTGLDYKNLGLKKLKQIVIPDFDTMANWGLINYREDTFLWDKMKSTSIEKQKIVKIMTHQLAHQWFGHYSSSKTISDEAFATYFEFHAINNTIFEDWEPKKQFVLEHRQANDLVEIASVSRGASILRMVEHFVTEEKFKQVLQKYLKEREKISFFEAIELIVKDQKDPVSLPTNVEQILENWLYQEGYPIITVQLENGNIVLAQEKDSKWFIPLTYSTKPGDFSDTKTKIWLEPHQINVTIPLPQDAQWFILNNQQVGLYRVNYDYSLLEKISKALEDNLESIDPISRSQLIHDQMSLAQTGTKPYPGVLNFLQFLANDTSYYSWTSAFRGFSYLLEHMTESRIKETLKEHILGLMFKVKESFPIEADFSVNQIKTLTQVFVNTWACNLNDEDCIKFCSDNFSILNRIPVDVRGIVYCNGLRHSSNVTNDFNSVYKLYQNSDFASERIMFLTSLGCINDTEIRKKYLNKTLTEEIQIEDISYVFSSVYSNHNGVMDILTFLKENFTEFKTRFPDHSQLKTLIVNVADLVKSKVEIDLLTDIQSMAHDEKELTEVFAIALVQAEKNMKTTQNVERYISLFFEEPATFNSCVKCYVNFHMTLVMIFLFKLLLYSLD